MQAIRVTGVQDKLPNERGAEWRSVGPQTAVQLGVRSDVELFCTGLRIDRFIRDTVGSDRQFNHDESIEFYNSVAHV